MPDTRPRRKCPSDEVTGEAWKTIMALARKHCLIIQAYGGTATLAMPQDQRRAGIRSKVLDMELAKECPR